LLGIVIIFFQEARNSYYPFVRYCYHFLKKPERVITLLLGIVIIF